MTTHITKANFAQEIEQETKPIVLDVYASWCGPCKMMEPIFAALEQEMGDTYKFLKLNVDEARELSIQYGVTAAPTFLFIKNNQIKGREVGYIDKEELCKKILGYLG